LSKVIQAVKGMNDCLPEKTPTWQFLEQTLRDLTRQYGYAEIRMPLVEKTALFCRSIGEVTDIVEKEMYTFVDKGDESLTLRPEGTASCVRAGIEHGLLYNQQQRLWYMGPMFRRENPQKGRYRQFHQFGAETFGFAGPDIDAELILMSARLWKMLGFADKVKLQLNSLGSSEARQHYRGALVEYLQQHRERLDADSLRRLDTNPLRILDSKNPHMREIIDGAPKLPDYLDAESKQHFAALCERLDAMGVTYDVVPTLVRGLDYYNRTVFEWVTDELGAQGTICAGGRYDGLVAQLGGQPTPACGFAMGLERIVLMLETVGIENKLSSTLDVYLCMFGEAAEQKGMLLAESLREQLPELAIRLNCGGGNFKKQLKRADKSGAAWALIIGDDEIAKQSVAVKPLRGQGEQQLIGESQLTQWLQQQRQSDRQVTS